MSQPASHKPSLREELTLLPSTPFADGAPCWTLHDPLANRFFELGQSEVAMLSAIGKVETGEIPGLLARQNIRVDAEAVERFMRFLRQHNLLQSKGAGGQGWLKEQAASQRRNRLKEWSRSYLSVRIPLVRPDGFLTRTLPWLRWWFSPRTVHILWLIGLLGLVLMLPQSEIFFSSFTEFFNLEGALLYGLTLALVKTLHELGHAYTAKYYGCRVPVQGVAFLVFWPVLYTDTTDAWRLTSTRARLAIGWAGLKVEMAIASVALLGWSLLPDGMLRSMCFLLSTTTLIMTLVVNLNPFMRFDGYYIFSDWLGVRNLQSRSSKLALWWLKEQLLGLGATPPEPMDRRLVAYAFAAYIYRFFLTLTIALLLYHMVFKLLGIILLVVHIGLFIVRPIWREVHQLWQQREHIRWNRRNMGFTAISFALLLIVVLPLHGTVTAPAILQSAAQATIYAPDDGRIARIQVRNGDTVQKGDILAVLTSETLPLDIRTLQIEQEQLRWQLGTLGFAATLLDRRRIVESDLLAVGQRLENLYQRAEALVITAPVSGVVADILDGIDHAWVQRGQPLMVVAQPLEGKAIAYVSEADLPRITPHARAQFRPKWLGNARSQPLVVESISHVGESALESPYLASIHGGDIATREDNEQNLIPLEAVYKVTLQPHEKDLRQPIYQPRTGYVHITAERQSLLMRFLRSVAGVLRRQSGM